MVTDRIRQIIEIIGIATIIASLVFVGMQLLLDRRVAMADQYFNRIEAQRATLRTRLESDAYFVNQEEMWELGIRPDWWNESSDVAVLVRESKLSARSLYYQITVAEITLLDHDSNYFQYQQGLLDTWNRDRAAIRTAIRNSEVTKNVFLNTRRRIGQIFREIAQDSGL